MPVSRTHNPVNNPTPLPVSSGGDTASFRRARGPAGRLLRGASIGQRLAVGFALVLAAAAAIGAVGYWGTAKATDDSVAVLKGDARLQQLFAAARADGLEMRLAERQYLMAGNNSARRDEAYSVWQSLDQRLREQLNLLESLPLPADDKDALQRVRGNLGDYESGFRALAGHGDEGRPRPSPDELQNAAGVLDDTLHNADAEHVSRMNDLVPIAEATRKHTTSLLLALLGAGCLLSLGVSLVTTRSITRPIHDVVQTAQALLRGETGAELTSDRDDETGVLISVMRQMSDAFTAKISASNQATARMAALADKTPVNLMFADREMKIAYVNPAALRGLESLEKYLPVKASQIVGQCIDIFHKDPSHQRRLLNQASSLPYSAQFMIGPETIQLTADAIYDAEQQLLGTLATWEVATEKLRLETANREFAAGVAAVNKAQPICHYDMEGTILEVNERLQELFGYRRDEVVGQHLSLFVAAANRQNPEYRSSHKERWEKLQRGEASNQEENFAGKQGEEIWVQTSYNPILDAHGKPYKIIHYLRDITRQKLAGADFEGQIAAISKAQAVIEFHMDGTVVTANDNFLRAFGYTLEEVKGKHHSLFVDEVFRQSSDYAEFWARLRRGEYQSAEYKRIGKGGRQVWIQASYNPILDLNGKPFKVVKYATDITAQKLAINAMMADAMMLSQAAVDGKLATRADASKHQGDYRKVVEGVNSTLDAVIGPLNVAAKYVDDISNGLLDASEVLQAMAANDYTRRLANSDKRVKITDTYNGDFNTIKNNLNACIEGLAEVGEATNKTADTVQASMKSIAQDAQALSSSSQQLAATSQQMSSNAEETSAQASTVATATQQVTSNLNSVATGAEEMTSTVQSISSSAGEAAKVAAEAVKTANGANATVAKLGESSAEIGQVIKVITSIAQQTNLLALNATIEAARAGEAGKGFAVVANEVKELAKQTAKATEDISQKITAIQDDTKRAVEAIGSITAIINQINDISGTIATAVEEQSATTNEMSRNVQEAAKGSGEISQNIQGVATAAESTTRGAQDTLKAAQQLTEMATQLRTLVDQFKLGDKDEAIVAAKQKLKASSARASA